MRNGINQELSTGNVQETPSAHVRNVHVKLGLVGPMVVSCQSVKLSCGRI